jgi:chemotaxis protein MotB
MSSDFVTRNPVEPENQIVIIRRRAGAGREEPHTGIWKIAYADFMTAMMAFFLVMWLLNATDKQTMSAVASYFNPVKLTDRVNNPKGLHDMESGARGDENAPAQSLIKNGKSKGDPVAEGSFRPTHEEDVLFSDPYGVLAKLATLAQSDRQQAQKLRPAEGSAGEAFRDPFDPEFRFLVARANAAGAPRLPEKSTRTEQPAPVMAAVSDTPSEAAAGTSAVPQHEPAPKPDERDAVGGEPAPADSQTDSTEVAEEIREALRDAAPGRIPNVEVASTADGILISLTDEFDFGMFAIASAEPRPELVVIMERIAQILKGHPGSLVVRGHTDGRPFRTATYDNWRLSSARAHMAYFMLVRGGVDEQRFERIEGHADRSLKLAGEPEAAQNRRIEIFLRKAQAS